MNRTLRHQRFNTTGPGPEPGEVLVATEFDHPERGPVRCPAAAAVGGWLRRRGLRIRYGTVNNVRQYRPGAPPRRRAILFTATYLDREGRAVGIGAAASVIGSGPVTAAIEAVRTWGSVMRTHRVVMAAADPACAGERAAVARVAVAAAAGPVFVFGQLSRNRHVADDLRRQGATFADGLDQVPDHSTIVFPAHGVPLSVRAEAAARGMRVVDATCPLVTAAHQTARHYADRGDTIVIIGKDDHAAMAGIRGQAPESTRVVSTAAEAETLQVEAPDRLSYLMQTGILVEDAVPVMAALRSRFPAVRGPDLDQFCYAASDRHGAIRRVAEMSEVLIVAGAAGCPDSLQARETAVAAGTRAHIVETAGDIRPEWLRHANTVGLTAGLSARPGLTEEVLTIMSGLGPLSAVRTTMRTELVTVALPTAVGIA